MYTYASSDLDGSGLLWVGMNRSYLLRVSRYFFSMDRELRTVRVSPR